MEIPLRYEYLVRHVFDCERGRDPWHMADADQWHHFHKPTDKSRQRLHIIIDAAILKYKDHSDLLESLFKQKERIKKLHTVHEVEKWVDNVSEDLNNHGHMVHWLQRLT